MGFFNKVKNAAEAYLDSVVEKAKTNTPQNIHRKGLVELDIAGGGYTGEQMGYKERAGLIGPDIMKSMSRKDSIVASVIQTRRAQIKQFVRYQSDKYATGWIVEPIDQLDFDVDQKIKLADPKLQGLNNLDYEEKKYEFEKELSDKRKQQEKDIENLKNFIANCGVEESVGSDGCKFPDFVDLIVDDRMRYNFSAVELVPSKGGGIYKFLPLNSRTIRYVSKKSASAVTNQIKNLWSTDSGEGDATRFDSTKPFRYAQIIRGRIVAAWAEDELIFKAGNPSVDPDDRGYGYGELEMLVQIITSHLYAEAHNRNVFTQGISSKGILHIKGDNISRAQLESFRRTWLNQAVNSKNAFRPSVIGMAEDVKWVPLSSSNREMEYENWMNYLIKITCAIYQIDPAEINFDISKTNTGSLNESNNDSKIKYSRDKGLKPLLMYIENIMNDDILPKYNKDLSKKYRFRFVGLDAETRKEEIDRMVKETQTRMTINEARKQINLEPIEGGDVILNGAFTQYLQMKMAMEQENTGEADVEAGDNAKASADSVKNDIDDALSILDPNDPGSNKNLEDLLTDDASEEKSDKPEEKEEETAKSRIIEYYYKDDE